MGGESVVVVVVVGPTRPNNTEERKKYSPILVLSPSYELLDILAKLSDSAFVSNSWILNRVNGSAQRRSLALEAGAFAAEGLLVSCFLRMCAL